MMRQRQKDELVRLRNEGMTYAEIAESTGLSFGSVKMFFYRTRRNDATLRCEQCHQLIRNSNRPQQRFCSYSCRMKWWARHPDQHGYTERHCFCCVTCGKSFYSLHTQSYCSRNCYYVSKRKAVAVND